MARSTMRVKILPATSITAPVSTDSVSMRYINDVSAQIVVTAASSPGTASVKLQASNDNTNWVDVGSATNITTNTTILLEDTDVSYAFLRVTFAIASGSFTAEVIVSGKE